MRVLKTLAQTTVLGCAVSMIPAAAFASGWSTEGLNSFDILFAPEKYVFEAQATYGDRNVDFEDVEATDPTGSVSGGGADDIAPNVFLGSGAAKIGIGDHFDFFAKVYQPYRINEEPGSKWAGRRSLGVTDADALGIDAMASFKHQIGEKSQIRVFGGVRSVSLDYLQKSLTYVPASSGPPATPAFEGDVTIDLETDNREYGYRIGAAFEIPEIALVAQVTYDSAIAFDLDGDFSVVAPTGVAVSELDATASAELPQSIEASIKTGVAPGWLVSLGVKWIDWSVLDKLSVDLSTSGSAVGVVERDLSYSDGWIVEAGVGHKLTDKLSLGANVGWDKGIGGPYSDLYYLGLGGAYDVTENVKLSLGGRAIFKTAGEGTYAITRNIGGTPTQSVADYEYDSSWNFAVSSKIRVAF
ncbi:OmpP1/FadL family transporter [Pseudovibrio sp. SCP19]|uniref:OmpP1/FadL family transporter n=1 Tax=Pseudovibrio sp. SCP19 TaxID=3141374 RepID=UPI0033395E7B